MGKTNQRLQLIVDEIKPGSVIADIGTDHGYLPIMAVEQNKAKKAYAADIAEGPLSQARTNINKAKLKSKIDVILTDGLNYFKRNNLKLDYAVIAGLGSTTICEILENNYKNVDTYLICSNTEPASILKLAKKLKLRVQKETYFIDNNRSYWLIKLNRESGTKIKSFRDINLGVGEILNNNLYKKYLKDWYARNKDILEHLKFSKKSLYLKKLNRNINKVINNGTK